LWNKKNKKGQSYSIELIIFVILLIELILFFIYFMNYIYSIEFEKKGKLIADEIANFLVLSPGVPRNWEETGNASVPGISYRRNIIDYNKLNALNQTNYTEVLKTYRFETKISLISNGTVLYQIGNITNSSKIYVRERVCVFENSSSKLPCILKIEIGEK
jgi:hypothetical protein